MKQQHKSGQPSLAGVQQRRGLDSSERSLEATPASQQSIYSHLAAAFPEAWRWRYWLLGLLLATATVLAYQPVWHAGFIWDDDVYVTKNPLLTAPDGLRRIWFSLDSPSQYFPLVYTTFRLERAVWGLDPAGYHWVNLLLHTANALLLWRLLWRLKLPGAWLAAAMLALHPVHVESVAWITERKNVLCLCFSLLSMLAWVEYAGSRARQPWKAYLLALVLYALALSSKTTACTLPAAMLLVLWWQGEPIRGRRLLQVVPFLLLGLGMGLLSMWWERYHQGTEGAAFTLGFPERVLIASRAVWFYAGKLLWPASLTFSYPRWAIDRTDTLAYGWLVAGMGAGAALYFTRRYVGRHVATAALFFIATLSPMLGFIMLYTFRYSFVADHYQYVASIGPIALAAAGLSTLAGRFPKRGFAIEAGAGGALLLVLGLLTWQQCRMYAGPETLWRATLVRNPESFLANYKLGVALWERGPLDEAIIYLHRAAALEPTSSEVHNNLGAALAMMGQAEEAIAQYQEAIRLKPDSVDAHYNLGIVLFKRGLQDDAIRQFRESTRLAPTYVEAHKRLGIALFQKGSIDEAIHELQESVRLKPDDADAHNSLGIVLINHDKLEPAIREFQEALRLNPGFAAARNNLARALGTSNARAEK